MDAVGMREISRGIILSLLNKQSKFYSTYINTVIFHSSLFIYEGNTSTVRNLCSAQVRFEDSEVLSGDKAMI
jgi:hypothetical protein